MLTCRVFPAAGGERGAASAEFSSRSGEGGLRHCERVSTDVSNVTGNDWNLFYILYISSSLLSLFTND